MEVVLDFIYNEVTTLSFYGIWANVALCFSNSSLKNVNSWFTIYIFTESVSKCGPSLHVASALLKYCLYVGRVVKILWGRIIYVHYKPEQSRGQRQRWMRYSSSSESHRLRRRKDDSSALCLAPPGPGSHWDVRWLSSWALVLTRETVAVLWQDNYKQRVSKEIRKREKQTLGREGYLELLYMHCSCRQGNSGKDSCRVDMSLPLLFVCCYL